VNPTSVDSELKRRIAAAPQACIGFDEFMAVALYQPGSGYYSRSDSQFGSTSTAKQRSDFTTAPSLSPFFGATVGEQVAQWLGALPSVQGPSLHEFGAGTGALMLQILKQQTQHSRRTLPENTSKTPFTAQIWELSAALRERQRQTLANWPVQWPERLPERLSGVIWGNEVLDAMPCKLLQRTGGVWHERCVGLQGEQLVWRDVPTTLRPPLDVSGEHDYLTEIHPQAEAFVASLAERMVGAVALFIDYGFAESEYYHPQRHMGTVMCHRGQRSDPNPLEDPGDKDITCHVNFTGIAMAAQNAGLDVIGYTTQGRFLLNCGLLKLLEGTDLAQRANAQKLVTEHEMGELFKVLAVCTPDVTDAVADSLGFATGDRTHTL
jgi:SAM-dependent MidA family methyltransferase